MKSAISSSIIWTLILWTSWAQAPSSGLYNIDASRSKIELTVFRGGLLKLIGHDHAISAKSFSGQVRFSPAALGDSSVHLSIDSASLFVLSDPGVSEGDRKEVQANMEGTKVLNVREFPTITFHSTELGTTATHDGLILRGRLNLHGVEKEIAFPIKIRPDANFLRVTGTAVVAQTDFGMKPIKSAAGGLRVKNQVNVVFDIVAERAK